MRRIILAALAALAAPILVVVGASTPAAPARVGLPTSPGEPMRTVLLPPIPAPPSSALVIVGWPPPAPAAPAPAVHHDEEVPVTQPGATPAAHDTTASSEPEGVQPVTSGTTVQVPQCVVTWTITQTNPDPLPQDPATTTIPESFDGNCTVAEGIAADTPGSTLEQTSLPQTS